MAKLQYKPRADSTPYGKPRVYFCCHPQDFEIYFPEISDEILKKQNCVIWYDEFLMPGEDFNQAIIDAMKKSHLFTLAVTPNLLEDGNYVMKINMTVKARRDLADIYLDLGEINQKYFRMELATKYFRQSLALCEELCEQTEAVEDRKRQADCCGKLGLELSHTAPEEGYKLVERAIKAWETVAVETKTVEAQRTLAEVYSEMAYHYRLNVERYNPEKKCLEVIPEQYELLISYYQKAIGIDEQLARQTHLLGELRRLMRDCERIGDAFLISDDQKSAVKYYIRCHDLRKHVYGETETSADHAGSKAR